MSKYALISVYDKTGVILFAEALVKRGYTILSTGGTYKVLKDNSVPVMSVSDYTKAPEILDGRVKSLHPRIHGGILARWDNENDMRELQREGIEKIDIVAVNLYPFIEQIKQARAKGRISDDELIEFIDIGGPTLIRAAAKNSRYVVPICDPCDYQRVISEMDMPNGVSHDLRKALAVKVFKTMSLYDTEVASYFASSQVQASDDSSQLGVIEGSAKQQVASLRYGENPHQQAGLYRNLAVNSDGVKAAWEKLAGKEISYNNLLDMQGALELLLDLLALGRSKPVAVVIKHSNPCGAAFGSDLLSAFERARDCDPVSAFGGIIALGGVVDQVLAEKILEGFVEVVCASDFTPEALSTFERKKAVRLVRCDYKQLEAERHGAKYVERSFFGDSLVQTPDLALERADSYKVVSRKQPSEDDVSDFEFAWVVAKHVKSNAIVVVKNGQAIGVGAGQMSRVDAARLAVERARTNGHDVRDGLAASDAFLPFADTLEVLNDSGVRGLIQPGGSIKDETVIESADSREVIMMFTGVRHFRH